MKKICYRIVALIAIACLFHAVSYAQMRNFIGSNGRVIEAEFLGFDEATQIVKLRLKDGREQNVKLDLFAAESQQWIKSGGKAADNPFGDGAPAGDVGKAGDRKILTIKNVEYAFRWCPSGTFMMGSPSSEERRQNNETQHRVTLSHGFWMLETEVTQQMWESVMRNNPSDVNGAKRPVEKVSWDDSQRFIRMLNDWGVAPAGFKFSLPTEAQWEYACRAGTTTTFHFGNALSREQANFGQGGQGVPPSELQKTIEVRSYSANTWGLYDMHGNVWEWCLDWQGDYPSGAVTDPTGVPTGDRRVIRGGGWVDPASVCRSAARQGNGSPSTRNALFGFRLALVRAE